MRSIDGLLRHEQDHRNGHRPSGSGLAAVPIQICLLGGFRVLKYGQEVGLRAGGKAEAVLTVLAVRKGQAMAREALLDEVWPDADPQLASQSLNSLIYSLHRLLGSAIGGAPVLVHQHGAYRLNTEAGVSVDMDELLQHVAEGHCLSAAGDRDGAAHEFTQAIELYRGDLSAGSTTQFVIEREQLRATCLTLLARVADYHYGRREYDEALAIAIRLLSMDPCREDAHRMVMRCHVHRGERAQALRQYRVCERILRAEFDAPLEEATRALFEQVRLNPSDL
jgi:DNA-binding SARP family transcriptional activator